MSGEGGRVLSGFVRMATDWKCEIRMAKLESDPRSPKEVKSGADQEQEQDQDQDQDQEQECLLVFPNVMSKSGCAYRRKFFSASWCKLMQVGASGSEEVRLYSPWQGEDMMPVSRG